MSSEPTPPETASGERVAKRHPRLEMVLKILAVLTVLGVHGWQRAKDAQAIPYSQRHIYPGDYGVSLAIMLGRGFEQLRLDEPSAAPVREFLGMRRMRLDRSALAAYDEADRAVPGDPPTPRDQISRTFDLYLAAGLWSIFGVSWHVYTGFYMGVSLLCGLLIFFTARRLSGSYGCGLLAAALYAAAPYEAHYMIYSVRDVSPLWFTIIAYWAVTCVADRFRSPWANGLSFVATGVATTVGFGWRPDVAMLVPVVFVTLVAMLLWKRRRWWHVAGAVVLFGLGAKAPLVAIDRIIPEGIPQSGTFQFLHVAYYADAPRSEILDLENSFQTLRHDTYVFTLAGELREHDPPEAREPWDTFGPSYGRLVRRLYVEMAQYHLFDWAMGLPRVCFTSLGHAANPDGKRFALWLPHVALLAGLLGAFVYRAAAPIVLSLFAFIPYYGAVFLAVLPEGKHVAPFVLPLIVLGALGLWLPFAWLEARKRGPDLQRHRVPRVVIMTAAIAGVVLVATALFVAHRLSRGKRQEYLDAIRASVATATPADDAIIDPRVFTTMVAFSATAQEGYLLDVTAGDEGAALLLRCHPDDTASAPAWETRHVLEPDEPQQFFFNCYRGWRRVGNLESRYTVRLIGDARIVGARRLDLAPWPRLPFATVFTDDDARAGSPPLDDGPAGGLVDDPSAWDARGLTLAESWLTNLRPPATLVAGPGDPVCRASGFGGNETRTAAEGMWVTAGAAANRYIAQFGRFDTSRSGRYVFTLETRTEYGDYAFGLLSGDQSRWMPPVDTLDDFRPTGETRIVICDLEAGESVVPTIRSPDRDVASSILIRSLEIARLERAPGDVTGEAAP